MHDKVTPQVTPEGIPDCVNVASQAALTSGRGNIAANSRNMMSNREEQVAR
jgi:hypothetical protein